MTDHQPARSEWQEPYGHPGQHANDYQVRLADPSSLIGAAAGAGLDVAIGHEQDADPTDRYRNKLMRIFSLTDTDENRALRLLASQRDKTFDNDMIKRVVTDAQSIFPNPDSWAYDLRDMLDSYRADPDLFIGRLNEEIRSVTNPNGRTNEVASNHRKADMAREFFSRRAINGNMPSQGEHLLSLTNALDLTGELIYGTDTWDRFKAENEFSFDAPRPTDGIIVTDIRTEDSPFAIDELTDQVDQNLEMIELYPGGIVELGRDIEITDEIRNKIGDRSRLRGYITIDDQAFAIADIPRVRGRHSFPDTVLIPISNDQWHLDRKLVLPGATQGQPGRVSLTHVFNEEGNRSPLSEAESREAVYLNIP